jgi:hypothetical protein
LSYHTDSEIEDFVTLILQDEIPPGLSSSLASLVNPPSIKATNPEVVDEDKYDEDEQVKPKQADNPLPSQVSNKAVEGPSKSQPGESGCKTCHSKFNHLCSLGMCQKCCSAEKERCVVPAHDAAKLKLLPQWQDVVSMLETAMSTKQTLWVRYNSGSKPNTVRPLQVIQWKYAKKTSFLACSPNPSDTTERTYTTKLVTECNFKKFT